MNILRHEPGYGYQNEYSERDQLQQLMRMLGAQHEQDDQPRRIHIGFNPRSVTEQVRVAR
jgi:hypothetical protein